MPALQISNLRVDYGDFTAVDDLNVTVGQGQIFGLVGPNGAGKTSTIRVLATLLEPTYGEVRIARRNSSVGLKSPAEQAILQICLVL